MQKIMHISCKCLGLLTADGSHVSKPSSTHARRMHPLHTKRSAVGHGRAAYLLTACTMWRHLHLLFT